MNPFDALRFRSLTVLALVAAALIAGCGDDGDDTTTAKTTTEALAGKPAIVDAAQLADAAERRGEPIYWVGERDGKQIELVESDSDRVYVRYLDEGVEPGVRSAAFLTIATYPEQDPVAALRREAKKRKNAEIARGKDGGVVLIDPDKPNSVYVAYPGDQFQIEVYSPDVREALKLATSGAVDPVR